MPQEYTYEHTSLSIASCCLLSSSASDWSGGESVSNELFSTGLPKLSVPATHT